MSDPAPVVVMPVVWNGQHWLGSLPDLGVYVHGRTLARVQASGQAAVTLAADGGALQVRVDPQTPELSALARAREDYHAALRTAIGALSTSGVCPRDLATACQVTPAQVRSLLPAAGQESPARPSPAAHTSPRTPSKERTT
jgi:hypothetical protein